MSADAKRRVAEVGAACAWVAVDEQHRYASLEGAIEHWHETMLATLVDLELEPLQAEADKAFRKTLRLHGVPHRP